MIKNDIYFMKLALKEANKAKAIEEVPIGAILVDENLNIVAKAYNKKEILNDVTGHAEILCIKKASKKINDWRLNNLTMYVTLEPCAMCLSAIIQSRIKRIIFGAYESNTGACLSHDKNFELSASNIEIDGGILEQECKEIVVNFFKEKRKK